MEINYVSSKYFHYKQLHLLSRLMAYRIVFLCIVALSMVFMTVEQKKRGIKPEDIYEDTHMGGGFLGESTGSQWCVIVLFIFQFDKLIQNFTEAHLYLFKLSQLHYESNQL